MTYFMEGPLKVYDGSWGCMRYRSTFSLLCNG
jgi:hypothetical protein